MSPHWSHALELWPGFLECQGPSTKHSAKL